MLSYFKHIKNKRGLIFSLFFIFCFSIFAEGCSTRTDAPLTQTDFALNTVISVTVYDKDQEYLLPKALDLCHQYENKLSRTMEGSEIWKVNHGNGQWVTVSSETYQLVETALSYCKKTDGAIDITIGPVKDLWNFSEQTSESCVLPDSDELKELLEHVDYSCVELRTVFQNDQNICQIRLNDPSADIDLGFIAKGYIADQMKSYLLSCGVTQGIINLGGNVLTIGNKPDGSPYQIGIQKPFADTGTAITNIESKDSSIVTSGIYERCFTFQDKVYHHILDSDTGYPVDNDLLSVTILSQDSVTGDALSTTCLILGLEEGTKLIDSLGNVEAVFVTKDYKIHYTY